MNTTPLDVHARSDVADTRLIELLADLAVAGVRLAAADDGQLRVSAPRGALTDQLRARVAQERDRLLAWLASQDAADRDRSPIVPELPAVVADPTAWYEPFPPSDLQSAFLIGSAEGMEHHVRPHQYLELDLSDLDPERFTEALNRVLRSRSADIVVVRDDLRLQAVVDPGPVEVVVEDLRGVSAAEVEARVGVTRAAMTRTEPPIDRWPWLDVRLTRHDPGRTRLHWNNNNLFNDAPGTFRLLDAVMRAYHHPAEEFGAQELSFRDCVLALADAEKSALGEQSRRYWTSRLPEPRFYK